MSAPHTDLDKQAKRHRGPLRGMFAVVLFALVLLAILGFWAFGRGGDPQGAATQVQSGVGVEAAGEEGDISANTVAGDEPLGEGGADPTAVTVPSQTVTAPQSGQTTTVNPTVGASDFAQPPDPVTDEEIEAVQGEQATD